MVGRKSLLRLTIVVFLMAGLVSAATVQATPADWPAAPLGPTGDWGDAPEGTNVNAYPFLGSVPASFPTCMNMGPAGWIYHIPPPSVAWFGPNVDYENEGNAGICPAFPPYNNDECFNDNDAGLIIPQPFTILGGVEAPCPGVPGTSLGQICKPAVWGANIDIRITNTDGPMFVNVVIDWNQSGNWGGASVCPGPTPAPEWVLNNFAVPAGFAGSLSTLGPPGFVIGPKTGYVWARFSISSLQIQVPDWDGSGEFQNLATETEDYLLRIDQALAITVDSFAAMAENGQVLVTWRTVSEIDNAGFNLWRSERLDGPRTLVAYVPSQAPGATAGAEYLVTDADVQAGHTYWYWLEDVALSGATSMHGPVSATLQAPTVVSLAAVDTQMASATTALPPWAAVFASLVALAGALSVRRRSGAR